jgi:hypothetical protein
MMPNDECARLPFVIDVRGEFTPSLVRITYDPAPRPTTPQLERLIAVEWQRQTALARQSDRVLFNGELLRYVRHEVASERPRAMEANQTPSQIPNPILHLTVGPTCYRDFVGTNLYNNRRLGEFEWRLFANPVGTTATLVTRDGLIAYGRRSPRVAYHAGHVHTFGGAFEACDQAPDGSIDPFGSLCRELVEELAVPRDELVDLCCVGLIRDKEIHQPEMLFEAHIKMTATELRHRWQSAEHRDEHDEIVTLPDRPEAIVPFIQSCGPIAPVAIGALFLHGHRSWGESWFRRAASDLGASVEP